MLDSNIAFEKWRWHFKLDSKNFTMNVVSFISLYLICMFICFAREPLPRRGKRALLSTIETVLQRVQHTLHAFQWNFRGIH